MQSVIILSLHHVDVDCNMTAYPTIDTTGLHRYAEIVPIKPVADWGARLSYHSSGDSICTKRLKILNFPMIYFKAESPFELAHNGFIKATQIRK